MAFILQVDENILSLTCTFVEYVSGELQWKDETGLHSETSYNVLYYNNQDIKDGQTWEGPDDVLLTTTKKTEAPTNPPTENEEPSVPESGGSVPTKYKCFIYYIKDNVQYSQEEIEYYWITRPSELPEFNYATEYSENGWVIESLFIQSIEGFELDRIDTDIDNGYYEQGTSIHVYYVTKQEDPVEPSQGKIATNEDIYNASKYIYGVNNNQCPTKRFILDNGYDVIKFNNEYQDNQCVVLEDLSFERIFDNITLTNNCGANLDAFGIYFSYDKPVDNNKYDFLFYEFGNKEIENDKTITLSKQTKKLSNIGDYRGKNLYVGFYSDGWGANRKFTFKIGNVSYVIEQDKSGYVGQSTSGYKIPVIDFLRHYYNKISIVIDKK
jgi:hypothetical protein